MRILFSYEFFDLHRGEKDFYLCKKFSEDPEFNVAIITSNHVSIADEAAGYSENQSVIQNILYAHKLKVLRYFGFRLIRKTHNKRVSFILPEPLSYLFQVIRFRPELIVDNSYTTLTPRSLLNYIYSVIFNKRIIYVDPGDEAKFRKPLPLERAAIHRSIAIFTKSLAGRERYIQKYHVPKSHSFEIFAKNLDNDDFRFHPDQLKEKFVVAYVGRFLHIKGFNKFLELAQLSSERIMFMAIGMNDDNFKIPDNVTYVSHVSNKEMGRLYSGIDLLVVPDLSKFKSYPTVVQEALMCGTQVWVGGLSPDYFTRPDLMHLYPLSDDSSLRETIARMSVLSQSDRLRQRMTLAQKAQCAFDPKLVFERMRTIAIGVKSCKRTK